jgi:hypothetical protein
MLHAWTLPSRSLRGNLKTPLQPESQHVGGDKEQNLDSGMQLLNQDGSDNMVEQISMIGAAVIYNYRIE